MSEGVEEEDVPVIYLACLYDLNGPGRAQTKFSIFYTAITRGQKIQMSLVFRMQYNHHYDWILIHPAASAPPCIHFYLKHQ